MQAVILAGGKGTRLKPYTISFPKPLVPVGDYPILEVIIRQLAKQGFKEIVISTGHLAELIEAYFREGERWGVRIRYVREDRPLNTAGALALIDGLAENFLVMNGDVLTTLDYGQLFQIHSEKRVGATIGTKVRESKIDFGVVGIDGQGYLDSYTEKPVYTFSVSMGVYVLNRSVISFIGSGEPLSMPDLLLRIHANNKKVYCHKSDCYWLDIGRVDDYERAQEEFSSRANLFLGQDA